jgi:putative effector of murein hydrolase LrgA (UPF0299 family)
MLIIPALWLICLGVVLLRRPVDERPNSHAMGDDPPAKLLRWAIGLPSEERSEWGEAMVSELAYLQGRRRRWRFALGCTASTLLPPWGASAAPIAGIFTVAVTGIGVYVDTTDQYGWALSSQESLAVIVVILLGFCAAGITLLRRPGVAVPGLLGGLVVAVMWLATTGYTFSDIVDGKSSSFLRLILMLAVPAVVGLVASLWSGSAEIGKRVVRLAALSSGLATFAYGCIAVMTIGSGGGPGDPGASLAATVSDRLQTQGVEFLLLLPTLTAVIGWAGAATTSQLNLRRANRAAISVTSGGHVTQPLRRSVVLCAVVGGAVLLVGATFLAG